MGFDYFVGELRCAACGRLSAPDASTDIQTKIRDGADGSCLGAGMRVDGGANNLAASDYLEMNAPSGDKLRILQAWGCAYCGSPENWVQVLIEGGMIREITAVTMSPETLAAAHFIAEYDARVLASRLLGKDAGKLHGAALLDSLHAYAQKTRGGTPS